MNFLRSSPFMSPAFLLQAVIFSCCVIFAGSSLPDRHDAHERLALVALLVGGLGVALLHPLLLRIGRRGGRGRSSRRGCGLRGRCRRRRGRLSERGDATPARAPARARASSGFIRVSQRWIERVRSMLNGTFRASRGPFRRETADPSNQGSPGDFEGSLRQGQRAKQRFRRPPGPGLSHIGLMHCNMARGTMVGPAECL